MRVASIEGHLRAALDGDFLISVDEAGPGVVIKVEHSHLLFDDTAEGRRRRSEAAIERFIVDGWLLPAMDWRNNGNVVGIGSVRERRSEFWKSQAHGRPRRPRRFEHLAIQEC